MHWLMLGVVAIALLLMSTRHPKFAFGTLCGLALAAVLVIFYT